MTNQHRRSAQAAAIAALLAVAGAASAASSTIRFNDYDGSVVSDPSYPFTGAVGAAVPIPVGALAGLGNGGNVFSGQFLWDNGPMGDSGIGGSFTNLPVGGTLSFSFLMAAIDNWGASGPAAFGDQLQFLVNGTLVWSTAINNFKHTSNNGGVLIGSGNFGGNPRVNDTAWDFSNVPELQNYAYTGTSIGFALRAAGPGWVGGPTQTWGIDNFRVVLTTPVPEPGTGVLLLAGLAATGAVVRRRRA